MLPLSGLQPPANNPVRASLISQLRSAISDTLCPRARNRNRLCISLCSLCFLLFILFFVFVLASIVTHFRRGEPRNTRNTRKVGKDNDPGLPVEASRCLPQRPRPRRFPLARRGEAPYGVRELVTAFWSTAACRHPRSRVPISQLRSAISDTLCPRARNRNRLCISLCSLRFLLFILFFVFVLASIVTHFRRGEPRNTRNTRKVGKDNDPGLPVGRLRFPPVVLPPPACFRRRRSAPYGIPDPRQRHIPRAFPQCFAAAGGKRIHSLALRACTRWRVPPTSTQREQVDRAFWVPRFRSLADPLACASSLYALARPPYKPAARASGSSVLGASFPVLSGPTRLRFELVRAGESPLQARSASKWIRCFGPCFAAAKPHMECGNLLPLSGLQPRADTPVHASPISQLRSAISDTLCSRARNRNRLCISLCSLRFLRFLLFILFFVFVLASIVTHFRRGEPRNTRNTRKWPTTAILPACRWKLHDVCPSAHAPGVFPLHAAAKPHMECGNLLPLSGLQPRADTPVRAFRSPNSDLRSPTPCVLVLEIVIVFVFPSVPSASSCSFSSLSSCWRQS